MNLKEWRSLLKFWCGILKIRPMPKLYMVPADQIPHCDATVEYDGSQRPPWTIRVRDGQHKDPDRIMAHELLHVCSELTDPVHERWIHPVSVALSQAIKLKGNS